MVDTELIAKELTGLIGLYPALSVDGVLPADIHRLPVAYLQDAHKLLRYEILAALGPNLATVSQAPYDVAKPYARYELVQDSSGLFYESQKASNTGNDLADTEAWLRTTAFSAWYSRIERGAITKLALLASSAPPVPPLLDNQALFSREGNASDTINKSGRFLGWQIYVTGNDTALGIERAGLQFTGAVVDFPIYIFHTTQTDPIAVIRITGNGAGRSLWNDVKKYLYQRVGGYYLIGYFEDDLPDGVYAIGAQRSFSIAGCGTCGGGVDAALYNARAPYVSIQPVYVQGGALTSGLLNWPDTAENTIATQSWGLNLVISAKCDVTRSVMTNKDLFVNALLYMVACDVLEEISTNDRVNSVSAKMTSQAHVALNGQKDTNDKGLKEERKQAISDLKTALSKISGCMAVEERTGITFGSVWD